MKTKKTKALLMVIILTTLISSTRAQVPKFIKQVSVTYGGVTDTIDLMPIDINTSGDVLVSGNEKMSSSQYNATTVSDGLNSWVSSFNPSSGKAFITCSTHDLSGNTYVAGGIRLTTGLDFMLVKYNSSGVQQWVKYYNGPSNTTDVISAITFYNGFVYVTGASDGGSTLIDYATLKYNATNGNQIWLMRYDYGNFIDIPTSISVDPPTGNVFVTGSSGTTLTNWDFATVKYGGAGAQLLVTRTANTTGNAQDLVCSVATDNASNMYVVGTTKNGSNYNVQLQKIDTALNTVYTRTFDAHGYDDSGIGVALDSQNNIYISGSSHKSNGTRELLVLKYDKNGNYKWKYEKQPASGQDAEGLRIKVKSDNEIFVGGNYGSGNTQDLILLCLDSMGLVTIEKTYNGIGNLKDKFMDMALDGNKIYVSARTCTAVSSTVDNNITITYEYFSGSSTTSAIGTSINAIKYINNEIWVSFNKKTMKMTNVNNKEFTFGQLSDFVQDSTCHKLRVAIDPDNVLRIDPKKLPTRKIYFNLTEADSISQNRSGNYIKVPEFYCDLIITLPTTVNNLSALTPLRKVKPDIKSAYLNHVFEMSSPPPPPATNDPDYASSQGALHPVTNYPKGHINVDSAWAVTTGTSSIRVGILDTGIEPGHSDLASTISGYDYAVNGPLTNGDSFNHGTPMAGIIGATRNNNTGVAGVAGGDASNSIAPVTLYDCMVCPSGACNETYIANALLNGALGTNAGGFALNVMNMSLKTGNSYDITLFENNNFASVANMNFANRNGVALIASKGNTPYQAPPLPQSDITNVYPADFSDETTMSVGGSGKNGQWCRQGFNCSSSSARWGKIDFVAPGTTHLIKTTDNQLGFSTEHGTSSAASFVSGATALLMSYRNKSYPDWDNLVHEDCEQILQRTATDLDSSMYYFSKPGYDTATGWGRINVYKAIKALNKNH